MMKKKYLLASDFDQTLSFAVKSDYSRGSRACGLGSPARFGRFEAALDLVGSSCIYNYL